MRLWLRDRVEERPTLISVISVIVFVAGRLPVLLVTSRRRVMDRRDPGGLQKNNIVGFLWQQPIAEPDRQVTASPAWVVCLRLLRRHFTVQRVCGLDYSAWQECPRLLPGAAARKSAADFYQRIQIVDTELWVYLPVTSSYSLLTNIKVGHGNTLRIIFITCCIFLPHCDCKFKRMK